MPPTTVALHPESHITGPVFGPFPSELVYTQCRIDMRPLPQMTSVGNEFFSRPIFFSSDYCQLHKTRIPKWQCWRLSWQIQSVRKQRAEEFVVTEVSGNRSDLASNVFTLWDRHIYTRESTNKTLSEGDIRPCVEEGRSTGCSRVVRETNCKDVVCLFSNSKKEFFSRSALLMTAVQCWRSRRQYWRGAWSWGGDAIEGDSRTSGAKILDRLGGFSTMSQPSGTLSASTVTYPSSCWVVSLSSFQEDRIARRRKCSKENWQQTVCISTSS